MSNMTRASYSDHFGSSMLPVLDEIFNGELPQHPSIRDMIFKVESMDRDITQYSEIHELDLLNTMSEGEEYSFVRPKQGASKTFTAVKYGLGFKITEEMIDDGKYGWVKDAVRKLARSATETKIITAMNVLNNGFDSETTSDGQYVFDTDHTLPSGLTFRNELSSAADLSPSALDQALTDFETQFVGDAGIIANIKPKFLVCHPSNKRNAKEIVGSELKANTADNNMNPFREDGLVVLSSPHLTDEDAWFLIADPMDNGLRVYERQALVTKSKEKFEDDSILYKAKYREVVGAVNPYGLFGSPGAA